MASSAIASSAFVLASPLLAQVAPAPSAATPEKGTIIVTATRAPTPIDRVASAVTILDKAAIDRNQDIGVTELLLRTPSVSFSRNGGYGTATQIRIRGAETDQTVVVIDGVKLNDPSSTGGGYNFANLLVGDAARIEVLRGPQSILWGSQAIGGVVNIVTPLPIRRVEGSFDLEGGSRGTFNGRAAAGGIAGPFTWRIGGTYFRTDGISVIAPRFGGVEQDGYTNKSLTGRVEIALAPGVQADLRGYYSHGRADLDSTTADTPDYSYTTEYVTYAGLNVDLFGGRLRNRLGYGYTDTDRTNYGPLRQRPLSFDAAGHNRRAEYQGSLAIAQGWDAIFGAEHERSRFRSVSPSASLATAIPAPARGDARITSFYAKLNGEVLGGVTVSGGIRHDDHSKFGGKTLFEGGAVWSAPTGTILRARYGEGFKAPTLYQLFSDFGNQALAPEQAHGWEAGAEQHLFGGRLTIGGTYFERRTRDQIIFNSCTATSTLPLCFQPGSTTRRSGYYQNVARAEAHGIEASGAARIGEHLTLDGNYSRTVSEDRSPGVTYGLWLPRRPRHSANGSVNYVWPLGISTGVAFRWSGKTFDNAANTTELHGYTLVDLRAEVPINKTFKAFARIENLFDKEYQTAYRYGTLGRSGYVGVRARL
ncbi:TonB-dependent receptor domain-containing protein [Sphingomonas bacterium]|uniref:TonB-dependent receptor plug domain-containing protein n=1 Tax=Sphingomonas bacterium TaxID=1895847 RepID=UPI0015756459